MGKFCPKCGVQCTDDANFCMKCGYSFNEAQPAAAAAPQQQKTPTRPWVQNSGFVNPYPVAGYDEYNPTFHCRCEYCYFEFDYHTYDLGHRAWYPHGFVYCHRCQRPLRHKLEYEVVTNTTANPPAAPAPDASVAPVEPVVSAAPAALAAPEVPAVNSEPAEPGPDQASS